LEYVSCCLCGQVASCTYARVRDRLHGHPGEFTFVRCRGCGHVYLSPRPTHEELAAHYPDTYAAYAGAIEDEPNPFVRWNRAYGMAKRCRAVTRRVPRGRLLDVGCGTGVFLDAMRRRGWDVRGVEPTAAAARIARERFDLDVLVGTLEEAAYPSGHFDAVTLWYVIEHVPNPSATIAEIARVLRPGGLALMSAPNLDALDRPLFGTCWAGWDPPRHFNIFSARSLGRLLERHGFAAVRAQSLMNTWLGLALGLQFRWEQWRGIDPTPEYRRRHKWDVMLPMQALRLLALPYTWLADRLGAGTMIVVSATRGGH